MIIDNELVLFDNTAMSSISTSKIVKITNAYKPMFVYMRYRGDSNESGTIKVTIKTSDKEAMSVAQEQTVAAIPVKGAKGVTKVLMPIVDGKEFYVQATVSDKGSIMTGKLFVALVSDVDVR